MSTAADYARLLAKSDASNKVGGALYHDEYYAWCAKCGRDNWKGLCSGIKEDQFVRRTQGELNLMQHLTHALGYVTR